MHFDSKSSEVPTKFLTDGTDNSAETSFTRFAVITKRAASRASLSVNESQLDQVICRTFGIVESKIQCLRTDLGEIHNSKYIPEENDFDSDDSVLTENGSVGVTIDFTSSGSDLYPSHTQMLEEVVPKTDTTHITDIDIGDTSVSLTMKTRESSSYDWTPKMSVHRYVYGIGDQDTFQLLDRVSRKGKVKPARSVPSTVKWDTEYSGGGKPPLIELEKRRQAESQRRYMEDIASGKPITITSISNMY